ncbi:hypothetical protein [Solibacillus faecavium]|nr:hypothetical protein [Solibacillus faecavium]
MRRVIAGARGRDYRLEPCPQESVRRNGEQRLQGRHKNKAVQILR